MSRTVAVSGREVGVPGTIGRRALGWLLLSSVACVRDAAAATPQRPAGAQPGQGVLTLYLSRTNNTKAVAEFIHQTMGGALVPLELATPYPRDYAATVQQVARENETGHLPPLAAKIDRIGQYDIVFLGFPTWGMQLPPPIKSFLHAHDLKGKVVVPFNTNAGYGVGSSFDTVKSLCPQSTVLDGYTTRGGVERDGEYLAIQGARAAAVKREVGNWLTRGLATVPRSR